MFRSSLGDTTIVVCAKCIARRTTHGQGCGHAVKPFSSQGHPGRIEQFLIQYSSNVLRGTFNPLLAAAGTIHTWCIALRMRGSLSIVPYLVV